MSHTFTGPEFLKALRAGDLKPSLFRTGMVKPCDDDATALMFTEEASCSHWVKVPLDMIASVDHLGDSPCLDHHHPTVRLHLKDAPAQSREATVFANLLRLSALSAASDQGEASEPGTPPQLLRGDPFIRCPPYRGPCRYDEEYGRRMRHIVYVNCDDRDIPC
jgi:hypothetical protein